MKVLAIVFAVAFVALLVGAFSPVTAPGGNCEGCGPCVLEEGPFNTYGECLNKCGSCENPPCVPGETICEHVGECDGEV